MLLMYLVVALYPHPIPYVVQPKVFLFLIEPIKFVVDLFNEITLMKL